jgi:hypothetical protein
VQAAAAAEAYYREFQTAPAGYALLGAGPTDAGGNGSAMATVSAASFGLAVSTFQEPPAVLGTTVTATVRSVASVPLAVQPSLPRLSETAPALLPLLDARHAVDAVFEGWDTGLNGLALNWT